MSSSAVGASTMMRRALVLMKGFPLFDCCSSSSKLCERACVLYMLCFHRGQLKDIVKPDRFQAPY